jgi:prepilin-type N-terminal cleavage/methylation domain-containing protein
MGERRRMTRGFSLLEMVMVLAIAGLLAGVVLPQLQRMALGVEIRNQRADVKSAIEGLGYQAYASGKEIVLDVVDASGGAGSGRSDMPIQVPAGWRVRALQPVHYAVNGVCGGGRIVITDSSRVREAFLLKAPLCRLEPMELPE